MFDRRHSENHGPLLTILARADAARIKAVAEAVLPTLGTIEVVTSRTGLVMLPLRDTVQGTDFFLGEVLVAEAHLRAGDVEGYGMITGRDLERAMAMAVLDAARAQGHATVLEFIAQEASIQHAEDEARLRQIEATRVEMETF
ncbi:MAG: phosphonate C-P lyase system protein PhnG [Rhodobacteraceae bacterium]|nr:phosphonate C-P lyase system protein PhnG [Paracoccaceae bacterium]MCF8514129.1 phosphonate C-P lyase system protein PhnG [Paracoccaceae bacterium]MCF8518373.1 phosphonate C-P lyase system protein PhnG [Paracoccaceae bacterium]